MSLSFSSEWKPFHTVGAGERKLHGLYREVHSHNTIMSLWSADGSWTQAPTELIDWVKVLRPLDTKQVISEMSSKPISWLRMKKLNTIQQKHTFTNQKKCITTQNKQKKLKPGLVASYDIWPGKGEGLFLFRRFINLSLTYLDTYPFTYSHRPTWGAPMGWPGTRTLFKYLT